MSSTTETDVDPKVERARLKRAAKLNKAKAAIQQAVAVILELEDPEAPRTRTQIVREVLDESDPTEDS